ncbi:MAG: AraC family transcriptional regulator [Kiritimatiellae bacterium]|nr:AraC family transcriptional regulator [Kiritimatiellia bacterium]
MKDNQGKQSFLDSVDWMEVTRQLGELLPDQAFFIKDRQGRFMMQNRRLEENCRITREKDPSGLTDDDFWSKERVRMYLEGDRQVMQTGMPIVNEIAPAPEDAGSSNMILYSKFPIKDKNGAVIGIGGFYKLLADKESSASSLGNLYKAIQKMQQDYGENLTTKELARLCNISASQLERNFRKVLGYSPHEYLLRVRVRSACRELEQTNWTIARIAQECGFYDHSHFSRTFTKLTGVTPSAYRRRHGGKTQAMQY